MDQNPIRYKAAAIIIFWWIFFLPPLAMAQLASKATLYNSAYDYFEGDRSECITYQKILEELKHYPPTYLLIGLGAVTQEDWSGTVILRGTANRPIFYIQSVAEQPALSQPLNMESFPWMQLAVCNPRRRLKRQMKGITDVYKFIADLLQYAGNIELAAIKIQGKFNNISCSSRPVTGTAFQHPEGTQTYNPQEWELSGFYFKDYALQLVGALPGKPIMLFGLDNSKQRGGYIQRASVVEATVEIYPLMEYQVMQSDLSITSARLDGEKLLVVVKNTGYLDVCRAEVKMVIPDTSTEELAVISVRAREEILVKFNYSAEFKKHGHISFQVDPRSLIRESREDNNALVFRFNYKK
jgi:hypothetical protein